MRSLIILKNILYKKIMLNGNKQTSEKLLLKSLKNVQKMVNKKNFKDLTKLALINSSPVFYIKKIKRKRKNSLEFPFLLKPNLRISYSLNFMLKFSEKKNSFIYYFSNELLNSSKNSSFSVKKTQDIYKESFVKKKFANYRWF